MQLDYLARFDSLLIGSLRSGKCNDELAAISLLTFHGNATPCVSTTSLVKCNPSPLPQGPISSAHLVLKDELLALPII